MITFVSSNSIGFLGRLSNFFSNCKMFSNTLCTNSRFIYPLIPSSLPRQSINSAILFSLKLILILLIPALNTTTEIKFLFQILLFSKFFSNSFLSSV